MRYGPPREANRSGCPALSGPSDPHHSNLRGMHGRMRTLSSPDRFLRHRSNDWPGEEYGGTRALGAWESVSYLYERKVIVIAGVIFVDVAITYDAAGS